MKRISFSCFSAWENTWTTWWWKCSLLSNITIRSFAVHLFIISPTQYIVIKIDIVHFTSKGNYAGFKNADFHIVFNEPLLYQIYVGLQPSVYFMMQNLFWWSEKWILAYKFLIEILNNKGIKVEPCGTHRIMGKVNKAFLECK